MQHHIKNAEDLRWLLGHTSGFHGGYVTDVHMAKRRLLDEPTGREVLADTTVTLVIRYRIRGAVRVAKLVMTGVTDFSIFEQDGADCSVLSVIQAEASAGRLRFWFDPQGELYVVCEEARFEEVSTPLPDGVRDRAPAQWTFQAHTGQGPTVDWMLRQLDEAGIPCVWREIRPAKPSQDPLRFEGDLVLAGGDGLMEREGVHVQVFGPFDGGTFGVVLQLPGHRNGFAGRVLNVLADAIARAFTGTCLVGNTIIPGIEWQSWKALEGRRLERQQ